jgi:Kef-type K+ transport system membrane component KefB
MAQKYPEVDFIFSMIVAFFYAMVAETIGLSAIVGSFVAGVSLEGARLRCSKDFKEGAEYLRIIFASIFFVSLGVLVDFKAMELNIRGSFGADLMGIVNKSAGMRHPCKAHGFDFERLHGHRLRYDSERRGG